jgi:hypothetical protein
MKGKSQAAWMMGSLERASSALGLINWTLMLAKTNWFADLSIWRIHYVSYFPSDNEQSEQSWFVFQPFRSNRPGNPYRDQTVLHRHFLLLGVTLAEVATGREILISVGAHERPKFNFGGDSTFVELSKQDILSAVARESRSALYREAVRACFELDARCEKRGQRTEDTDKAIENILKPLVFISLFITNCSTKFTSLERYYHTIQRHHAERLNRNLYKTLPTNDRATREYYSGEH